MVLTVRPPKPRLALALASAQALLLGTACITLEVRTGRLPNVNALEANLILGRSNEQEVLRVLGEPSGRGRASWPIESGTRINWGYYYGESTSGLLGLKDGRRIFLFVFLDEGIYSGYLWFSSLPQHQRESASVPDP